VTSLADSLIMFDDRLMSFGSVSGLR